VSRVRASGADKLRISIFLSVFDVHVNRSPIAGVIRDITLPTGENSFKRHEYGFGAETNRTLLRSKAKESRSCSANCWVLARRIVFTRGLR